MVVERKGVAKRTSVKLLFLLTNQVRLFSIRTRSRQSGCHMNSLRMLAAVWLMLPSLCFADCVPGNVIPPVNDSNYCCSGAFEAGGSGRCVAVRSCLPGGSSAPLNDPGRCCSLTVISNGGFPICQPTSACFEGGHPASLLDPGACCSGIAQNNNGNVICAATNANAYAVGSVFLDLNQDKQQGNGEAGSDFSRNAFSPCTRSIAPIEWQDVAVSRETDFGGLVQVFQPTRATPLC